MVMQIFTTKQNTPKGRFYVQHRYATLGRVTLEAGSYAAALEYTPTGYTRFVVCQDGHQKEGIYHKDKAYMQHQIATR